MADDMVMRSVYVRPLEDAQLRQLARTLDVSKSDLIRSAISLKLKDWLSDNSGESVRTDLKAGLRDTSAQRQLKSVKPAKVFTTKEAAVAAARSAPAKGRVAQKGAKSPSRAAGKAAPAKKKAG